MNDNGFCYTIHNLSNALRFKNLYIKEANRSSGKILSEKQTSLQSRAVWSGQSVHGCGMFVLNNVWDRLPGVQLGMLLVR